VVPEAAVVVDEEVVEASRIEDEEAEAVDAEAAVADSVIVDEVVLVVAVASAQTEEALGTSKARSRLSTKSKISAAAQMLLRRCLADLWVVGFVGCGLLTILLHRSCGH
jgi:hypothetical protein